MVLSLLMMLKNRFCVKKAYSIGSAADWFRSCLTGRNQCFGASNGRSEPTELTCRVPRGSVLGPVKFVACTEDLYATIDRFSIRRHSFADDTQLLTTVQLSDVNSARRCLQCCVTDVQEWCAQRVAATQPWLKR